MHPKVAIIYNEPTPYRYGAMGEEKAVFGVLEEVEAVHRALTGLGYSVTRIPLSPPLDHVREILGGLQTDVVFNLFEGFEGCPETEAAVADILSELGLTHTGCPGAALSLALDKGKTKAFLEAARIPTPKYQILSPESLSAFRLRFPCIVKPYAEDASHGLSPESVVNDPASLERQVRKTGELFGGKALVEEFVDGREFNITVLGSRELVALPISEIVYSLPPGMPRILTFSAKWEPESIYYQGSKAVCPAEIGDELRQRIVSAALRAFRLLGCSGYARVDFRLDSEGVPKVIEVNPNPDISPDSGAARQARAAGMDYSQFIERLALLALEKGRGVRPVIRPMTGEDKPIVMKILRDTPEFSPADVIVAEEVLDSYLQNPSGSGYRVLVAEISSAVAGYICYGPTPLTQGTWDVYWVAVARQQQGRGVGQTLMAFMEEEVRAAEARLVFIETSSVPSYERTRRFYYLQGYGLACQIADFYAPGDDKVIFQKRLK